MNIFLCAVFIWLLQLSVSDLIEELDWFEDYCTDDHLTYCKAVLGRYLRKEDCTLEKKDPRRVDCGRHFPKRHWECRLREEFKLSSFKCKNVSHVTYGKNALQCTIPCYDNGDPPGLESVFCHKGKWTPVINTCKGKYEGCPHHEFLDNKHRECKKVNHASYSKPVVECTVPCVKGDKKRKNGLRSIICHKGQWYPSHEDCMKCDGKERHQGTCNQTACKGVGDQSAQCFNLHSGRTGGYERCYCACDEDRDSPGSDCSKLKCVTGEKAFCGHVIESSYRKGGGLVCRCFRF